MPSAMSAVVAPPARRMAAQPRLVLASSAPSVVAIGTTNDLPSSSSGPTTPTGSGTKPTTASQFVLRMLSYQDSTSKAAACGG